MCVDGARARVNTCIPIFRDLNAMAGKKIEEAHTHKQDNHNNKLFEALKLIRAYIIMKSTKVQPPRNLEDIFEYLN